MTKNKQAEIVLKASNNLQEQLDVFGTDNILIEYNISSNNISIDLIECGNGTRINLYDYDEDGEVSTANKLILHCEVKFNDFYGAMDKIYDAFNEG